MHADDWISTEDAVALRDQVYSDSALEHLATISVRVVDRTDIAGGADLALGDGDEAETVVLVAQDFADALAREILGDGVGPDEVIRVVTDQLALTLMEVLDDDLDEDGDGDDEEEWLDVDQADRDLDRDLKDGALPPAMVGGWPTCPACGDSLFIEDSLDPGRVYCDRDGTLIRMPPDWRDRW